MTAAGALRIGSEAPLEQLPRSLQELLRFERFHIYRPEFFQENIGDPTFDVRYLPQNCGAVSLPCFWIHRKHVQLYGRQCAGADELYLFDQADPCGRVLFPIHPLCVEHCRQFLAEVHAEDATADGMRIWAVPTSSTRTFLAWPDGEPHRALCIKTSLHSKAFGDRQLGACKVARSVGFSMLFESSGTPQSSTLGHFPERLGLVPKGLPDCGVIVRSIPEQILNGQMYVAPLFALLGGSGSNTPLLLSMLQRTDASTEEFVQQVLCRPFASLWLETALHRGLLLEAHAQNMMLSLSVDRMPLGGFFYRDFEGLQVDWELRATQKLSVPPGMPRSFDWQETYATWGYAHSQLVWYKLYISLFDYLHFVLNEVELSLQSWHARGLVRGPSISRDSITLMFSRQVFGMLRERFGARTGSEFNVYRNMKRFVLLLLKVRRDLLDDARNEATRSSELLRLIPSGHAETSVP
jgi:hypothetical protein